MKIRYDHSVSSAKKCAANSYTNAHARYLNYLDYKFQFENQTLVSMKYLIDFHKQYQKS